MSFNEYWQAEQVRRTLQEAIGALKEADGEAHARFFQALQQSLLLLPIEVLPPGMQSGDVLAGSNVPLQLKLIKGAEDKLFLPLFTSEAHLRLSHSPDQLYLLLPFPAVLQVALQIRAAGILIDRGGPASATVQASALLAMAPHLRNAPPPPTAQPPNQPTVRLGPPPRVIEHREVAALNRWLQQQPGLSQAYLFGLVRGATTPPILALGLAVSTPPPPERFQAMGREVGELLGPSAVTLLSGEWATLLARQAGAIRFDFRQMGSPETSEGEPPPSDLAPPPA